MVVRGRKKGKQSIQRMEMRKRLVNGLLTFIHDSQKILHAFQTLERDFFVMTEDFGP